MKHLTIILAFLMTLSNQVSADIITLSCQPSRADFTPRKVIIDLEAMTLQEAEIWKYRVDSLDENFIVAFQNKKFGIIDTSVFVLDRRTGEFWRSDVSTFCKDISCKSSFVDSDTLKGICTKNIF